MGASTPGTRGAAALLLALLGCGCAHASGPAPAASSEVSASLDLRPREGRQATHQPPPRRAGYAPEPRLPDSLPEWASLGLVYEQRPDFLPPPPEFELRAEGPSAVPTLERPHDWRLSHEGADRSDLHFLPEEPFSPALMRAGAPHGSLKQVGRALMWDLARPYVQDGREALSDAFHNSPLTTSLALGGAMALGVGAYVGLTNLQNGQVAGGRTVRVGTLRMGFTGEYDLRNGAWAAGVRFDLSRIFPSTERRPIAPSLLPPEPEPRGIRLLSRWLSGEPAVTSR